MKESFIQKLNANNMCRQKNYYQSYLNIHAHTSVPWQQIILNEFLNKVILPHDAKVLDAGTGIGNNMVTLEQFFKEVITLDIAPDALEVLKRKYTKKNTCLHTVISDIKTMPFEDNFFDLVICTEVLEHCENINKVTRECLRVLRPGGYIIVSSPNYFNFAGILKTLHEKFKKETWDAWGNHTEGIESNLTSFKLHSLIYDNDIKTISTRGGDCIRSWVPFFRKYYNFIDKHPCLKIGRIPIIKYFLMNFFILGQKPKLSQ